MGEGRIRFARVEDAEAILGVYRPYVLETAFTFECAVPTLAEFSSRVADILARHPYLVYEEDGAVLAYAYAGRFAARAAYDYDVETSVYAAKGQRGRGIGRRLYAALLDILAAQGYYNAVGVIATPNPISERLHAAFGFSRIGGHDRMGYKFNRWYGVVWYCKSLRDFALPPGPIRGYREVGGEMGIS